MESNKTVEVLYNKQILPAYYKLGIGWKGLTDIEPGQFVMLRLTGRIDPLLRRPFGVYKILGQGIEILYKVVGKGTRLMTGLRPGDMVDILGPLGNSFPNPISSPFAKEGQRGMKIIMVAGGIGIVPFYLLGVKGQWSGSRQVLLFGGMGKEDLPGLEDFKKLGINIFISTEDGSVGKKGLVTDLLRKELSKKGNSIVYACGPKGMLKEVARIADKAGVACYVSLDQVMACGMGACLGCAVKVRERKNVGQGFSPANVFYKIVCKDGPVFDAKEIDWEAI